MAALPASRAEPRRDSPLTIGALLVLVLAGWTVVAARAHPGANPAPELWLLGASAATYLAVREIPTRWNAVVPALVALLVVAAVVTGRGALSGEALVPPLHYANANGALYLQASLAGLLLAVRTPNVALRVGGVAVAVAFVAAAWLSSSVTAGVLATALLLIAALTSRRPPGRTAATIATLVILGSLAGTVGLALHQQAEHSSRDVLDHVVAATLSERRPALWLESLVMMADSPLTGVGPARFQDESAIAHQDRDARWAHSGVLQQGAETGLPGAVALTALLVWLVRSTARSPLGDRTACIGTAGLTALVVHSGIEYVLHFPLLVLAAVALAGYVAGRSLQAGQPLVKNPAHRAHRAR
jgi:O-antigen ligase